MQVAMVYDANKREAVFTFENGKTLTLGQVTETQASRFKEKHAPEFARRDACFTSDGGEFNRG
jgi:hypothetical protein